jgi:hypothetical protein
MIEKNYILWLESLSQTGEKPYLQNWESLDSLEREQTCYNAGIIGAGTAMFAGAATVPPGLAGGSVALATIELSRPVDRLVSVIRQLIEKVEGITVTPRVKTNEGTIDLLVKMPDRRCFAFALRSKGESRIKWREEEQEFFAVTPRKGKTARVQKYADLVKSGQALNRATLSLKKEKNYLLGESRTERNAPITKAIVLTSKTTVDPSNDPGLFVDFGLTNVLRVYAGANIHVLEQSKMIDFLASAKKM